MKPDPMSIELAELENRLRDRADDEPMAGLRERVMRAVAAELAIPQPPCFLGKRNGVWWAAVAAGVLIVLNLSMLSASQDEFSIRPARSPSQTMAELRALRQFEAQQEGMFK